MPPAPVAGAEASESSEGLLGLRHKGLLALLAAGALIALLGALVMAYKTSTEADFDALARLVAPQDAAGPASSVATRMAQVRDRGRAVAVTLAVSAGLGVVLIGVVVVLFFARLSGDIEALRSDALAVVAGGRTPPPPLARHDELGDLSRALGELVRSLAAREADLEIERRHAFHREKMGAIGALAAGVLNDIGNPIAAIDGFARAMKESHDAGECSIGQGMCDPDLILHETARLQVITRQIAQLATEQSSRPQLLSLNDIVRTTLLMMHFDPRLSGVRVETALDPQLPAVPGVADRLLQLVMGLTVHAADPLLAAHGSGRGAALISIKTGADEQMVELALAHNGPGMNPDLIRRAFAHTDAPIDPDSGTVLGLAACRAIVAQHGGAVQVDEAAVGGPGVCLRVRLPLQPAPALAGALQ
jgi:C4-dicarboxylate-specific signal transduction histidine kinase